MGIEFWFFVGIALYIAYQLDKKNSLENRSNNRSLPPNTRIDYAKASEDIIKNGKKAYYANNLAGKYDKPYNSPVFENSKEGKQMKAKQEKQ